jgi:hypothetical protein
MTINTRVSRVTGKSNYITPIVIPQLVIFE